jgi:hypothetical protein
MDRRSNPAIPIWQDAARLDSVIASGSPDDLQRELNEINKQPDLFENDAMITVFRKITDALDKLEKAKL